MDADEWTVVLPRVEERGWPSSRIWASASGPNLRQLAEDPSGGVVRFEPGETKLAPAWAGRARLSIPLRRSDVAPAIGLTGCCVVVHDAAIRTALATTEIRQVGLNPNFRLVTPASDEDVHNHERALASAPAFDFFGVDWVGFTALDQRGAAAKRVGPGIKDSEFDNHLFREHRKLPSLPDDGTWHELTITVAGLEAIFQVRKIDLVHFFENPDQYKSR